MDPPPAGVVGKTWPKGRIWLGSWTMGEIRIDGDVRKWVTVSRPAHLQWRRLCRRGRSEKGLDRPAG